MSKKAASTFSVKVEILVNNPKGNTTIDISFSDVRLAMYLLYKGHTHKVGIFSLSEIRMMLGRDSADYLGIENVLSKPSLLYLDSGLAPVYLFTKDLDYVDFIKWAKKYASAFNWTFALKN